MAPEVISGLYYDKKVDIWALGVLVYEMALGTTPANGITPIEILSNVINLDIPEFPEHLSEEIQCFISTCLKKNPDLRPSAAELRSHNFLSKASKEDLIETLINS